MKLSLITMQGVYNNQTVRTADFWSPSYKYNINGASLKKITEQGELADRGYLAEKANCKQNGKN